MLTVDGLATGLDTGRIIEGMLEIQKAQIDRFSGRKQEIIDQQTAFRSVEARLLELQSTMSSLRRSGDNVFQRKQATSTDEAIAVSASNRAIPGVYTLTVDNLAQAHQIASNSFAAENEQIAKGTFTFQVGNGDPHNITIGEANNTLEALARDINEARQGVTAGILNDGSSYRLLLTANEAGAANLINVTYSPDPQDTSAVPTFDLQNPVQNATDASVVFGAGAGAITVTSPTNQLDDVLPGLTLNLLESDPNKPITINVTQDTEPAREAIGGFVESYNDLMDFIDEQQQFNPESGEANLLFGNRSLRKIRDTLALEISGLVPGLKSEANRLSAIGINIDSRNRLTIRSSELNQALNGDIEGIEIEDVQKLFGLFGETDNPEIRFISASDDTRVTDKPYRAEITQTAERARILASSALPASVLIDGANDEFSIKLDGKESGVMKLTQGRYSSQELASHLGDVINNDGLLNGRQVSVSLENNSLEISSVSYGSSSRVEVISGTSLATLGFTAGQKDSGQNVVGKFVLEDGTEETANGSGQYLLGDQDDGVTNGLRIRVTAAEGLSGLTADVTVSRGIVASVNQTLNAFFLNEDNNKGELAQVHESFSGQIESIDLSIDRLNARFEAEQQSLIRQFTQLETAVSELQSTGNLLSAQLAGLPQIGIQG